jgi:hypothetical protein
VWMNPGVLALIVGGILACIAAGYGARLGAAVLQHWDLTSGSERQVALERKTDLVSVLLGWVMGFEFLSLFMFVHTADYLHDLFVGAMCAAGTLKVNEYGYPALILKVLNAVLCGLWLLINRADIRAPDYPLIRVKYTAVLIIAGLSVIENGFQVGYWMHLNPNVITSCCGSLFSTDSQTLAGDLAHLPPVGTMLVFFASLSGVVGTALCFYRTGRGALVLAVMSGWFFILALTSILSFISVYIYQLPTHHCPFCLLQREYGYVGYPLYVSLFIGGIAGMGIGALDRFKGIDSLTEVIPQMQRRLCLTVIIGFGFFGGIALYPMVFSEFKLIGY